MNQYLLRFTGIYVLCCLALSIAAYFIPSLPNSLGIVALIAAVAPVGQMFARDKGRVPTSGEKASFATLGTLASLAVSAALFLAFVAIEVGPSQAVPAIGALMQSAGVGPVFIAAVLAFAIAVSWLVIYFFSGMMAKQALKQLAAKK
jgi:hypothetical protein